MISAVVAVEPVKEVAVLASVVVTAADGGEMAADVDVATNARSHMRITLILLTPTGILLRTSGNASGLCARMSYSYKTAVVVAAEEATRVTMGATRIDPPAVYPQQMRTLTIPPTR
jgi:hypothetical protein